MNDLSEEIKILEEKVELYYDCAVIDEDGFDMRVDIAFMKKDAQAIENVIKGYRELEEKNKNLYDLGKAFANNQLKIKMRNKIDELKKKYELADEYWQYDYDVDMKTIEVLQELMEDK